MKTDLPEQYQRCRMSERHVGSILREFVDGGIITGFRKTRINSYDDRHGVDFYVFHESGRMPLQVKSSWSGWRHHNYRYRSNPIPCVVGTMPTAKLRDVLLRLIRSYFGGQYAAG